MPGRDEVLELRGRAAVTGDDAIRAGSAVAGKVPKAAIVLTVDHAEVRTEPAIGAAGLWDTSTRRRCRRRRGSGSTT